jgi:hypothetical protein
MRDDWSRGEKSSGDEPISEVVSGKCCTLKGGDAIVLKACGWQRSIKGNGEKYEEQ